MGMRLFTAGPVACFPWVLEEMGKQMFSHRSPEYQEIHMETVELMKWFLNSDEYLILVPSSGTGLMEASVRNGVSKGGSVLVTIIGAFGNRYSEVVETNGRKAIKLVFKLGDPVDPDILDKYLGEHPEVEAVTVTHNETSTGVINDLETIGKVVQKYDVMLFVDAVSSMGAADIDVKKLGIDFVFSSSQKAFGVPPGLAFAAFSKRFLEKAYEIEERGWYFDIPLYVKYLEDKKSTPSTPPIPQVLGLRATLRKIKSIGKETWFEMYRMRAERIRKEIRNMGLRIVAKEGYESPTITAVYAPEGVSGNKIYYSLRERGIEIAKGYGPLRDKTFRIGHMGHITDEDIEILFRELRKLLKDLKP